MGEVGLYEAMSSCRAVRRHRPDEIPDEVVRRLIEAATWAPTGGNNQPWRVIAVRDAEVKQGLQELYLGPWNAYEENARRAIEGLEGEARASQERGLAAAAHLAHQMHRSPVIFVFCFNPQRMAITDAEQSRPSVVGGGSVYPAVQNLLLAARAEGLGCVLTTLLCMKEPEVRALLEIPEPWATCAFVPVGVPASRGHGPLSRRPPEKMAFRDRWGTPLF